MMYLYRDRFLYPFQAIDRVASDCFKFGKRIQSAIREFLLRQFSCDRRCPLNICIKVSGLTKLTMLQPSPTLYILKPTLSTSPFLPFFLKLSWGTAKWCPRHLNLFLLTAWGFEARKIILKWLISILYEWSQYCSIAISLEETRWKSLFSSSEFSSRKYFKMESSSRVLLIWRIFPFIQRVFSSPCENVMSEVHLISLFFSGWATLGFVRLNASLVCRSARLHEQR